MPKKQKHRIVIDTNIWISFLLSGDYTKLDALLSDQSVQLLFSQELLDEFIAVAKRPKFKKYFSLHELEILLLRLHSIAAFIQVNSEVDLCRDAKDNFLLALCEDGKATHLLTGDNDLLSLSIFKRTTITTIGTYLSNKLLRNR